MRRWIALLLLGPLVSWSADIYWVDDDGVASWASAESDTPLSGASCCSLSTALSNAAAGDTVYLRAGTYTTSLAPSNSGSIGNVITFAGYNGETVVIDTSGSSESDSGIYLTGQDYIKFDGITVQDCYRLVHGSGGSTHIELANCTFQRGEVSANGGVNIRTLGASTAADANEHWWIHGCTIALTGEVSAGGDDDSNTMKLGSYASDYMSGNFTIESNLFYSGGHHLLETYTSNNVIRANVFHNEAWMESPNWPSTPPAFESSDGGSPPKWGNRCIQIYDGSGAVALWNVLENNRVGHAGEPPDGNGANNIVITSPGNIVRYNFAFNANEKNIHLKQGAGADSENNRIYNNTTHTTTGEAGGGNTYAAPEGIFFSDASDNNVVKNNIFYNSDGNDIGLKTAGNTVQTNFVTSDGNPGFVNASMADPTSLTIPDLSLVSTSACVDAGTYLTQANGAGTDSTTLVVDDSMFFQDGSRGSALSSISPDWISIGTVGNTSAVASIDYSTHTITLATARTWSDNASVWLKKDSLGRDVLQGTAPDIGAFEFPEPDTTAPELVSASVGTNGYTLTLNFSEDVVRGAGYSNGDMDLDASTTGNGIAVTYVGGDGTPTLSYTNSSRIVEGESVDLDWAGTANGLEDGAGNDLGAISSFGVTNNSVDPEAGDAGGWPFEADSPPNRLWIGVPE